MEAGLRALRTGVLMHQTDPVLAPWATHFYKVTMNYWPGLFHCYANAAIPRTNNDLEQSFGAARHHERRATGQKRPTATVGVRGSVRVVAAVATQGTTFAAADLQPPDLASWQQVRASLEARHARRRAVRRFRRDPAAYLAELEARILQQGLPA